MCKKTRNIILNTLSILWFVIILYPEQAYTKEQENDVWYAYEALTSRLGSEWYKIGVLKNDLASIRNILDGLRNLQLFPSGITRLNEDKIVAFDREIEKVEKKHLEIIDELNKLRLPLLDAISIVREMAVGDPVEDMFEVIKAGDIKRLSEILAIKHRIDILWKDVDQLIVLVNKDMGLSPFDIDSIYGLEKEFFEILKANLGLQSESYYKKMNVIKDSLVNRADNNGISQLYKIEIHQTKVLIKQKKEEIAKRNIISMKERYLDRRYTNELNILLTYIYFSLGDYLSTLETVKLLPDEPAFTTEKLLYTVQSWYALQEFNKAWQWGKSFDFTILKGKNRNIILWLVMESGLALDIEKDYSKFAEKMDNGSSYNLHIMHALARSYLRKGEPKIALSIFKKALKREPDIEVDKDAYHRIVLAKAQTLFETGDYQNALKLFFELLNTGHNFEEGLFGISLCYIQLDMYQKAETSLRKLINQSPQSPRSAEAILITAKRYISKARYEWKKTKYLTKEKKRLESILQELSVKLESVKDNDKKEKYKLAFIEIEDMLKRVNEEYIEDYSGIISYYTKALNICDLIPNHYETGSFQDVSFSEKRETVLHKLDSLILATKGEQKNLIYDKSYMEYIKNEIRRVKNTVKKSYVLATEMQIDEYRWMKEFLDWKKMLLSDKEKELKKDYEQKSDSLYRHNCLSQIKKATETIDSLVEEESKLHKYWYEKLSPLCLQQLQTSLDSNDEIYLRYHLGELYYKHENRTFASEYEQYERNMMKYDSLTTLFRQGKPVKLPKQPKAPVLDHTKSMQQYKAAIAEYPDNEFTAAIRYSLAWCYNDLGMFDSAVIQMTKTATEFKDNPFTAQAWMFIGEYFFDNAKLDSAIYAYREVLKRPESEWFDDALYKLAWTQYRLSHPEKAISSFLALVDLGKGEKAGKALLETESFDYIAISFSESDLTGEKGLKRAIAFCNKLNDDEKGTKILHRLAGVYEDQGRYEIAKETYRSILKLYPQYQESPLIESKLISVMARDVPLETANMYKIDFFEKYNRDGRWAGLQTDSVIISKADSIASSQLYDASVIYHQIALQKNDSVSYNQAMSAYQDFIRYYPSSPLANECHYNLAEILFSTGQYYKAAEEYIAVSKRYPDSKYKETAAWNAIVASQNLLKQEGDKNK